ncbi:MAG: ATP-binding protein [Nitrospirota bacterium]
MGDKGALMEASHRTQGAGAPPAQHRSERPSTGFRRLNVQVLALIVVLIPLMVGLMIAAADRQFTPLIRDYYGMIGMAVIQVVDNEATGEALNDPAARENYLHDLVLNYENLFYAAFYVRQGERLAKVASTDGRPAPLPEEGIAAALAAHRSSMIETTLDNRPVSIVAMPLHFGALEPQAVGVFVLDLTERQKMVARQRGWLLGIGAGGSLLIMGSLAFVLRRRVVRPVEQLTQAVQRVAAGDLSVELPRGPANELGMLADSFNGMVADLRNYLNRVEEQGQQLMVSHQEQVKLNQSLEAANRDMAGMVAKLEQSSKELKHKNQELEAFVYTVSHDLKTPLVSLQGLAGILFDEYSERMDEEGRHCLKRLVDNTNQMGRLIQDLLAFSRIGRMQTQVEAIDAAEVARNVVDYLQPEIAKKQAVVDLRPLPRIIADRSHVQQLFSNLISNAIKFAGHNGTPPRVEVGAREADGMVEFYVKDNGIGIEPQYQAKVFEIFQRLQEVDVEGTGVGLSIVRKIVEQAGGGVRVVSAKGEGAVFYFTWPRPATAAATNLGHNGSASHD